MSLPYRFKKQSGSHQKAFSCSILFGSFAFVLTLIMPAAFLPDTPLMNIMENRRTDPTSSAISLVTVKEDDGLLALILSSAYVNVHSSYMLQNGQKSMALSFNVPNKEMTFTYEGGDADFYICNQKGNYVHLFYPDGYAASLQNNASEDSSSGSVVKGSRDNTPQVLAPVKSGSIVYSNEKAEIDASNATQGYIFARYNGSNNKVKLQITGADDVTYTYNMATGGGADEVFPLSAGSGSYLVNIYENISGTQYSTAYSASFDTVLDNDFLPYLYPNQYVWFTPDSLAVQKGAELAYDADNDLDVVNNIYNFMITNITYDYQEAETVESGYIPDVDEVLTTQKGICLDYACLMATMLRSQRIPTHMEVGYAGTAYHAWISCYIADVGWVNGIVQFDGTTWELMDPTFGSTTPEDELRSFLSDSSNYAVKYIY